MSGKLARIKELLTEAKELARDKEEQQRQLAKAGCRKRYFEIAQCIQNALVKAESVEPR